MKYFKLKNNADEKMVGRYPQFEGWKSKGNLEDYEKNKITIEKILPPHFNLSKKAIKTIV